MKVDQALRPRSLAQAAAEAARHAEAALRFNEANAAFRDQRWADALALSGQALALDAELAVAHVLQARCHVRMDRLEEARDAFAGALRLDPAHFSAWLELGNVSRRLGARERAVQCYERAAACNPQDSRGYLACARALEEMQEAQAQDQAASYYHKALMLAAGDARKQVEAHHTMGRFRLDAGLAPRALEALRAAVLTMCLEPGSFSIDAQCEVLIDQADALLRLGLREEALTTLTRASAAAAEGTLTRLAQLSFRFNLWQEAVEVLRRSVALHPHSGAAHYNLALMLTESWQMEDALAALDAAQAQASMPDAASMRAAIAGKMGDADAALKHYRALVDAGDASLRSSVAMSSLYSDTLSAQEVAQLHRELFAGMGQGARDRSSFQNDRDPQRPLRIGLVSADFHHQHPVNLFMQPMLARWNREQFPLTLYFTGVSHDDQTHLAKSRVSVWREMTQATAAQFARQVEADGIDILIDLAGHTSMQRIALFAQRMAPVQATFLGYPGSTGIPNMDWIFGDPVVTPPEHDALYSERVARLPDTVFCYAPEADYPYPEMPDAQALRPLTFGSFNNIPKLTPHTIRLWARVLGAVPDSRLILKAPSFQDRGARERYARLFSQQGVDAQRIEFRGPVGLSDMMAEYADVDIGLDPVPYNGGTTTLQAMWMGVPVLVKEGGHFVSRMGASFMRAAGLPDWIATDDDAYVHIAARMAQDRQALLKLKRGLRQRTLAAAAWNPELYTRNFGLELRKIWSSTWTNGR
ncbi:TPR_REGION domain-containing protein [Rubrivivax sp. A210]|nr:TPR_REGION domain-containing protein [Rubrivivax sp. A210]